MGKENESIFVRSNLGTKRMSSQRKMLGKRKKKERNVRMKKAAALSVYSTENSTEQKEAGGSARLLESLC
jgi:hypothetical protein